VAGHSKSVYRASQDWWQLVCLRALFFVHCCFQLWRFSAVIQVDLNTDDTEMHNCNFELVEDIPLGLLLSFVANTLKLSIPKSTCNVIDLTNVSMIGHSTYHLMILHWSRLLLWDQYSAWQCHIEYALDKIYGKLYLIHHLKRFTCNVMRILCQAHLLPIIDYCDKVWACPDSRQLK